jgi:hypothetical protein
VFAGAERASVLTLCEAMARQLDQVTVATVAGLDRDGVFAEQGYASVAQALSDLVGWERFEAHSRVVARLPQGGGKLKGRFDDAAMFDAIATVIDARSAPLTADDDRSAGERQADALVDVCGYVLNHGSAATVPERGGHRPHVNVLIRLEDLENRARAGCLSFGGPVAPESLRMHHIVPWESGGGTKLDNLVMLCRLRCRLHHRQIHSTEWIVRIRDGLPEFVPPKWVDVEQRPRRRALPHLAAGRPRLRRRLGGASGTRSETPCLGPGAGRSNPARGLSPSVPATPRGSAPAAARAAGRCRRRAHR